MQKRHLLHLQVERFNLLQGGRLGGTLTMSDLKNKADYQAESISVSAGVGLNKQSDGTLKNASDLLPTASAGKVASPSLA